MKSIQYVLIIVHLLHLAVESRLIYPPIDDYSIETRFVFPTVDDFPTDCKLPEGSGGMCRMLQYCPAAITAKKVNTCYFDGNVEYVCCKENLWNDVTMRPFTANCGAREPRHEIIAGLHTEYKEFSFMVCYNQVNQ